MKLKYIVPLFFLFFTVVVNAQKEANFWFFGENVGLDFSNNGLNLVSGSLSTDEGSASISDVNGNLQFYTDGSTVYRRDGAQMANGTGLFGNSSSTQSAIIVPKPKNSQIYYVFTVGNQTGGGGGSGVFYSEVNMGLDGGFGNILNTNKNISLPNAGNAREKITSVAGEECNTFWVITSDSSNFYAYKIDENGVNTTPVISSHSFTNTLRGYLKLSPDGELLVSASQGDNQTFIYNFNSNNGQITNERRLNIPVWGYGVEFSRDSKQLYITTGTFSQVNPNSGVRNPPATATLEKFNLDTNKDGTIDDINTINSSRAEIYRTNSGYRGALQLATNGKIYYARSRTSFLGVINNPEEADPNNIDFNLNGVDLSGRICTEGLPPFIQSFFLPIEVRDNDTGNVVNDQELKYCIGQTKTISPQSISGTGITYEWTFNNGTATNPISNSKDLNLTNISTANIGTYNLKISLTDTCGRLIEYNATFKVDVFEAATATKPTDITFCDVDRDGFNQFNLNSEKDAEILNGLDNTVFEVLYFENSSDANSGNNPITSPYTNPSAFSSRTIYARVQNKLAPNACFDITDFKLSVTDLPVPTQPTPYRICDNTESGSDTDGIINTFILNTKDDEIYGSLDKNQYTISYHTTKVGAENNEASTVIDKNINYSVTNSTRVFVRIENKDNTACSDTNTTLDLVVDPLPVLKPNPELDQCIAASNTNPTVNLTNAEFSVSETPNATFTYFEDAAGTNQISDPTSYPVQVNATQSVFVRVTTNQTCSRDLIELKINVGTEGNNAYNTTQPPVCDDSINPTTGNIEPSNGFDTDRTALFNLDKNAIETGIRASIVNNANTKILFFENIQDRANTLNEIDITNYRNNINKIDITNIPEGIRFPIYYKIVSTINNDCQGLGEFFLEVHAVPEATTVSNIEECDDALSGSTTDGRNSNINLRTKVSDILGAGQTEADFAVTFHTSQTGAINNTDRITNDTNYTNETPAGFSPGTTSEQTIFVRVQERNGSMCYNANTSFKIIIQPIPTVPTNIPDLIACDVVSATDTDARNRIAQNIDLTARNIEIFNGRTGLTVEYYITQQDAENRTNAIADPTNFENTSAQTTFPADFNSDEPAVQTIFFVIVDSNGLQCPSVFSTFQLFIYPEPFVNPITVLSDCDNANDGDDTNGIIQNIDLNGKIPEILGSNRNPNDYTITFHSTSSDADSGSNALSSPYTNSNRNETIHVRVQQKVSACVNSSATFDIVINSLPDFSVTTPQILCLNDLPLNISVENPGDTYSYEWQNASGNTLGTNDNLNVSSGGKYTVIATDNVTLCQRIETIQVNESNIATLNPNFVTIVDESNNLGSENNISISIDTITNNLGPGDYQFAILNTDTNTRTPFIGYQDEPLFEDLEGGIYQIIVNDKNGCSPDATLLVSVIQFPKFFTPNGDNENDTWEIKGTNKTFYPNSSINIFNRYGKLVAQIQIDGPGWNGTYNGTQLPSDDYWYNVTLVPSDNTKPTINKRGNFSLLRR